MADQRIGDNLYNQIMKAIDYFIDEFDATEYEVIGALEWAKAVYTMRNIEEPTEDEDD